MAPQIGLGTRPTMAQPPNSQGSLLANFKRQTPTPNIVQRPLKSVRTLAWNGFRDLGVDDLSSDEDLREPAQSLSPQGGQIGSFAQALDARRGQAYHHAGPPGKANNKPIGQPNILLHNGRTNSNSNAVTRKTQYPTHGSNAHQTTQPGSSAKETLLTPRARRSTSSPTPLPMRAKEIQLGRRLELPDATQSTFWPAPGGSAKAAETASRPQLPTVPRLESEDSPDPEIEENYNDIKAMRENLATLKQKQLERKEREAINAREAERQRRQQREKKDKAPTDAATSLPIDESNDGEITFDSYYANQQQREEAKRTMSQMEARTQIKAVFGSTTKPLETGLASIGMDEARALMSKPSNPHYNPRSGGLLEKIRIQARRDASRVIAGKRDANLPPSNLFPEQAALLETNRQKPSTRDTRESHRSDHLPLPIEKITPEEWMVFNLKNQGWTFREMCEKWPEISKERHGKDWFRIRYKRMRLTYPDLVPAESSIQDVCDDEHDLERNRQIAQRIRNHESIDDLINEDVNERQAAKRREALSEVREKMPMGRPTTGGKFISPDLAKYLTSFQHDPEDEMDVDDDVESAHKAREPSPPAEDDKIHYVYHVHRRAIRPGESADDVEWFLCGDEYENVIEANEAASKELRLYRNGKMWPLSEFHTMLDDEKTGMARWTGIGVHGTVECKVVRLCRSLEDDVEPKSKVDWLKRELYDIFERRVTVDETEDWNEEEVIEEEVIEEDEGTDESCAEDIDKDDAQAAPKTETQEFPSDENLAEPHGGSETTAMDTNTDEFQQSHQQQPTATQTQAAQCAIKEADLPDVNTNHDQRQAQAQPADLDEDYGMISSSSSPAGSKEDTFVNLPTPAASFPTSKTSSQATFTTAERGKLDAKAQSPTHATQPTRRKRRLRTVIRTKTITRTIKTHTRPVGGVYGSRARANHFASKAYLELRKDLDPNRRPTMENIRVWSDRAAHMEDEMAQVDVENVNVTLIVDSDGEGEDEGEADEMKPQVWVEDRVLENPRNL